MNLAFKSCKYVNIFIVKMVPIVILLCLVMVLLSTVSCLQLKQKTKTKTKSYKKTPKPLAVSSFSLASSQEVKLFVILKQVI